MKRSYLIEKYFNYYYTTTYENNSGDSSWDVMAIDILEPIITPMIIQREIYEK